MSEPRLSTENSSVNVPSSPWSVRVTRSGTVTEKLKVCVKKWIPRCGMHEQKPHLENCCKSKKCCVMVADKSPIVFKCLGCGQSAREEGKIAHDAKDHEKKAVKTCEASGTAPHGGEPIK